MIEDKVKLINDKELIKNQIKNSLFSKNDSVSLIKLNNILTERREYAQKVDFEHVSLTKRGVVPKSARYERDHITKDIENKKLKVTRLGDLVFNPANLKFGVISVNKYKDGVFSPIYVTMQINPKFDNLYIEYLLTSDNFVKYIRKYEQGTIYERMAVSSEDFLKGEIAVPYLDQQQKIGNLLSSMDK